MVEKKTGRGSNPSVDTKLVALGAIVILLLAGAFFIWQGGRPPGAEVEPPHGVDSLPAKLLLSAYDAGAKLEKYDLRYMTNDSGSVIWHDIRSDGVVAQVVLAGDFGSLQGDFGTDTDEDQVCLEYGGELRCSRIEDGSRAEGVATMLRGYLPNKKTYGEQKALLRNLIEAGAITFGGSPVEERYGAFSTWRVSYSLSYKDLTVGQLNKMGMSPNDPEILGSTDQRVAVWVDRETGLIVGSRSTYKEYLVPREFENRYEKAAVGSVRFAPKPGQIIASESFDAFYQQSMTDYGNRQICYDQPAKSEQDLCFKSYGAEKKSWEVCKLIENKDVYEQCTLIVAQGTNNRALCEKLDGLADDCYIAIAGKVGDFELCKLLKNQSLSGKCTEAAAVGLRAAEEENLRWQKVLENRNCEVDADCKTAARRYCVPKNNTATYPLDPNDPFAACFENASCGCIDGYCGFAKNATYYRCVGEVEDGMLEKWIAGLGKNSTNETGA